LKSRSAGNNVPFEVVNDGEVTALAGSMSLGRNAVLGIALGTSTAGGYVTTDGNITSWLNELAFGPRSTNNSNATAMNGREITVAEYNIFRSNA
jgi:ABC-type sugar transport system ATPase subunit